MYSAGLGWSGRRAQRTGSAGSRVAGGGYYIKNTHIQTFNGGFTLGQLGLRFILTCAMILSFITETLNLLFGTLPFNNSNSKQTKRAVGELFSVSLSQINKGEDGRRFSVFLHVFHVLAFVSISVVVMCVCVCLCVRVFTYTHTHTHTHTHVRNLYTNTEIA